MTRQVVVYKICVFLLFSIPNFVLFQWWSKSNRGELKTFICNQPVIPLYYFDFPFYLPIITSKIDYIVNIYI